MKNSLLETFESVLWWLIYYDRNTANPFDLPPIIGIIYAPFRMAGLIFLYFPVWVVITSLGYWYCAKCGDLQNFQAEKLPFPNGHPSYYSHICKKCGETKERKVAG